MSRIFEWCQRHSIVAIQHFQIHGWTLNQEIKNVSKMSTFRVNRNFDDFSIKL